MATALSGGHTLSYYAYTPSFPLAITASVLFSLTAVGTILQFMRYGGKVWVITILVVLMESVGYIFRSLSTQSLEDKNEYIVQQCLIVLAPVLMAAGCYVIFGRIVYHIVPRADRTTRLLWVAPRWVTPIFVTCDIIALGLQLIGAVILTSVSFTDSASTIKSKSDKGKKIGQIGVAVQLVCFGLFSIIAVRFNFTSKRFLPAHEDITLLERNGGKYVKVDGEEVTLKTHWQALLRVVNIASLCILIRSIFRMVDFSLGRSGYTATHEWTLYVFDFLVMFPACALFIYWFPAKYLPYLGFRMPVQAR